MKKVIEKPKFYDGCIRVYEERKQDKYKLKREINGKLFQEINSFRIKEQAGQTAKDYKECGFLTRIVKLYGGYVLFVRKE
jgi:hypothetical protein